MVELSDHQGPVQCVLVLEDGDFLTGSNDTTVKLWSNGTCKHTFKGHTDTVRSVHSKKEASVNSFRNHHSKSLCQNHLTKSEVQREFY